MLFLLESVQAGDPSHGPPGPTDTLPEEEIPGKRGWNPSEEQIPGKNCWASSRKTNVI
jgi:hypothetical protein